MKTLTHEQADLFRSIRPKMRPVAAGLQEICSALATFKCGHVEEHEPETCPVCAVYEIVSGLESPLGRFGIEIDRHLLRGPVPTTTK